MSVRLNGHNDHQSYLHSSNHTPNLYTKSAQLQTALSKQDPMIPNSEASTTMPTNNGHSQLSNTYPDTTIVVNNHHSHTDSDDMSSHSTDSDLTNYQCNRKRHGSKDLSRNNKRQSLIDEAHIDEYESNDHYVRRSLRKSLQSDVSNDSTPQVRMSERRRNSKLVAMYKEEDEDEDMEMFDSVQEQNTTPVVKKERLGSDSVSKGVRHVRKRSSPKQEVGENEEGISRGETIPYEMETMETALRYTLEGDDMLLDRGKVDTTYRALHDYSIALRTSCVQTTNRVRELTSLKESLIDRIERNELSPLELLKHVKSSHSPPSRSQPQTQKLKAIQVLNYQGPDITWQDLFRQEPQNIDTISSLLFNQPKKSSSTSSLPPISSQQDHHHNSSSSSSSTSIQANIDKNHQDCTCYCHTVQEIYIKDSNSPTSESRTPRSSTAKNNTLHGGLHTPKTVTATRIQIVRWTPDETRKLEEILGPYTPHDRITLEKCREIGKEIKHRSASQIMSRIQTLQRQKLKKFLRSQEDSGKFLGSEPSTPTPHLNPPYSMDETSNASFDQASMSSSDNIPHSGIQEGSINFITTDK